MQALTKCCLLGRTLASGGQREYLRYQTSSPFQDCCFSRSREARDSARATLQAMTLAWEEQWLKCTMSHDTTPLAIFGYIGGLNRSRSLLLLPPQRLHAAASASVRQQAQTGHLAKALAAGVWDVRGPVSRHHIPSIVCGFSHCQKSDKTRPRRCCLLQFLQQSLYRPAVPPSRK